MAMSSSTVPTPTLLQPSPPHPTLLIILIIPLSLLLLLGIKRNFHAKTHGLPPSPFKLPIIGNLHQLGPLPHRSLHALSQRHGPVMLLHLGQVPTLVVSSPDAAREVMRDHDLVFANRPALKPAMIIFNGCKDLGFSPYGDYWRQLRKICAVHLLSSMRVQSYHLMREEEVAAMIGRIASLASSSSTGCVDMSEVLNSLSNDIICRVVSGKFTRAEGRNALFRKLIEEVSLLTGKFYVGDYVPWLGWLDRLFGLVARAKKNKERWDDLLDEVIREHGDRLVHGEEDFVDVLLSLRKDPGMDLILTPANMKALLMDILSGGTDTSYITLEYAMAELVRNPGAMKKLQDEVRRIAGSKGTFREEELKEMMYLKAVIKEVLRLHPPAPLLVPRELSEDCQIQGYRIAKKTRVFVNAWSMLRDPKYWETPEEFKPERFMDGAALDFKGNDFQFIPFGAGRRICPGMHFAVSTVELALANLVYHFDWELPGGLTREEFQVTESAGITARLEGGLHLVAKPWSSTT